MGMTQIALAATLFGPEDLRIVEQPLGPLAEGMVRTAFGAAGICGSDMYYFRHARTGNFVVTAPLVLGHEVAGTVVEVNARGAHWASVSRCLAPGRLAFLPCFPQSLLAQSI
jgi:L-idonate 5-dehydrogenase